MPSVANAVEQRFDTSDPRLEKAMKGLSESKAAQNQFGMGSAGLGTQAVLGKFEESIKLMIATLKNQDPSNPVDTKEMSQMFSMYAQTQGIVEIRDLLQQMTGSADVTKMLQAANQLDNMVKVEGNEFIFSRNESCELGFYAPPEAKKASFVITDDAHQVVRIIDGEIKASEDGYQGIVWDGKDSDDLPVKPGKYQFRVSMMDEKGEFLRDDLGRPLEAKTTVFGRAMGGDLKAGKARIMVGAHHYPLSDLISIQSGQVYQEKMKLLEGESAERLLNEVQDRIGEEF